MRNKRSFEERNIPSRQKDDGGKLSRQSSIARRTRVSGQIGGNQKREEEEEEKADENAKKTVSNTF